MIIHLIRYLILFAYFFLVHPSLPSFILSWLMGVDLDVRFYVYTSSLTPYDIYLCRSAIRCTWCELESKLKDPIIIVGVR